MEGKVDSRAMREVNRSLLLELIRGSGRVSRTELARRSALTKPTVSAIVEELIAEGTVHEVGLGDSVPTGGRRARLIEFNASSAAYLGIRFGVHTTRVAVADARGVTLGTGEGATPPGDAERAVQAALGLVDDVLGQALVPRERLQGAGVALGGLVESRTGTCVLSPHLGWRDFPLRQRLEERLVLPVTVSNVADAAALAEGRAGTVRGCRHYVWLYLGTGVGAGIVLDGQPFRGSRGFSGEIGWCRMGPGGPHLEDVASGRALQENARGLARSDAAAGALLGSEPRAADVIRAALAGEPRSRDLLARAGTHLGVSVSHLINLLDPEAVVLGGPLVAAGAALLEPLEAAVRAHAVEAAGIPILLSALGQDAATLGAIFGAMDHAVQSYRIVAGAPRARAD